MSGLRILIADDHEVVRRGIRSMLEERRAWRVCGEAATCGETIDKTRTLRPDVLLLDVTMPDRDAAAAIPDIVDVCPTVKIVALTLPDSAELAARALAAGASGLALKSDSAADLVLAVQSVGKNSPFLSPAAVKLVQGQLATARPSGPQPSDLTPRELDILRLLAKGRGNEEVATILDVSVKTVYAHRANVMRTLKLRTYSDLIQFAIRHKILEIA